MAVGFEELVAEMGFDLSPAAAPDGSDGAWQLVFARFGRLGFVRCLAQAEQDRLVCHFAIPDWQAEDTSRAAVALSNDTQEWMGGALDGAHSLDARVGGDWGRALAFATQLSEAVERGKEALTLLQSDGGRAPGDAAKDSVEVASTRLQASGFETIGEIEKRPSDTVATVPALRIHSRGSNVHVTLQIGHEITASQAQETARALRRQLRAYLDVDVDVLPSASARSVELEVRAAEWADGLDVAAIEHGVAHHLRGLLDVLEHGVSPAVFLGVAPPPTSANTPMAAPAARPAPHRPAPQGTQFVLGSSAGPLRPGDFDDARLRDEDSEAALVDVVLRHPGFSDRRVGQVLSILLSVEYHRALQLMRAAPVVIARGVSRDRALTFRDVVGGAGGKIQLTDPDVYPEV